MDDSLDELVKQNKTSLSPKAQKALEEHIQDYRKLILKMAHKYRRHRVEYEDLVQEAMIGLILADKNFDETRSSDFHTYAIYRMKGRMYEYCIANESPIYVPTHVAKAASYVKQMWRLLEADPQFSEEGVGIEQIILHEETSLRAQLLNKDKKHLHEEFARQLDALLPLEAKLSEGTLTDLRELKRKLGRIAHNSKMSYEELAAKASQSISLIVSDDILLKVPQDDLLDEVVASKRLNEELRHSLGEKRFTVLQLRAAGWNYREIAEELFRRGYSNKQGEVISRQAVKGILDETIKAIKKSKAFSDPGS